MNILFINLASYSFYLSTPYLFIIQAPYSSYFSTPYSSLWPANMSFWHRLLICSIIEPSPFNDYPPHAPSSLPGPRTYTPVSLIYSHDCPTLPCDRRVSLTHRPSAIQETTKWTPTTTTSSSDD